MGLGQARTTLLILVGTFPQFLVRTPDLRCLREVFAGEIMSWALGNAQDSVRLVWDLGAADRIRAWPAVVLEFMSDEEFSGASAAGSPGHEQPPHDCGGSR
jgi:hypothetical protein